MSEYENGSVVEKTEYTDEEMHALIDGTMTDFDEGDLVAGTIVKVERDEVLLDIGYKSEGVIPARELSIRKDANPADIVSVGDQVEALVLQKEDKDGRLILSKKRAEYERAWSKIEEKFNSGENVEGEVIEVVKGGLILDIGLRGFLPASLVDLRRVKDLAAYTGTRLEARVIEMDRNRNNVVLSRRVVLEEGRKTERAEILGKLAKGQILPGTISSIVDFGAFVDLGGIDGLVHISELSWSHVNHPSEVVKVGDPVEVKVLEVDLDRERISLGLKQTQPDPWQELVKNFPVGSIIEGKVTKLVPFGAFVELGDNVEGLVHISEMAKGHVETPDQVTAVGETVHVKVQDVDLDRRRISLSMRSAAEDLGIEIVVPEREPVEGEEAELIEGEVPEAIEADEIADVEADVTSDEAAEEAAEEPVEAVAEEAAAEAPEELETEVEVEVADEAAESEAAEEPVEALLAEAVAEDAVEETDAE
ncbi:MAG: 30S ribosomal protein S1 [Actinobacteria bacterium HGW-Actinobacteria-9]|jgi:small subunit ribosomal protein S1|nr:MAG: 30S ribosomal protein S1 [Actinobacteria bacterium HGW-Actinobacteria-9]